MSVTVIIPCLNESAYVGRLLGDLARQDEPRAFQVVVVDSASTDDTADVARSFSDRLDLRVVAGTRGVANARNLGAADATTEWLLFLDADVQLPDPRFVRVLEREAERRQLLSASAEFVVDSSSRLDKVGARFTLGYLKLLSFTQHPVALGFCIFTRRTVFKAHHGFDNTLALAEDYDYVSRSSGRRGKRGFAYIGTTKLLVDLRRFHEGGKNKEFIQAVGYEAYRFTHGFKIARDPFNFKFGEHDAPQIHPPKD